MASDDFLADGDADGAVVGPFEVAPRELFAGEDAAERFVGAGVGAGLGAA